MNHRFGSVLFGIAVTVVAFGATACKSSPTGGTRGYGSAPAPQPAARSAYVAPAPSAQPTYVAPAPQPAYVAPAPQPVAFAGPARTGLTTYLFLASWCGYCSKLERNTLPDPTVRAELAAMNMRRMNPDTPEGRAAATRYGVNGYPSTVVVDGNGTVISKIVGYQDPTAYAASLRAARR